MSINLYMAPSENKINSKKGALTEEVVKQVRTELEVAVRMARARPGDETYSREVMEALSSVGKNFAIQFWPEGEELKVKEMKDGLERLLKEVAEDERISFMKEELKKELGLEMRKEGSSGRTQGTCYSCGGRGHRKAECPTNRLNKNGSNYLYKSRKGRGKAEAVDLAVVLGPGDVVLEDVGEDVMSQKPVKVREARSAEDVEEKGKRRAVEVQSVWNVEKMKQEFPEVVTGQEAPVRYCRLEKCGIRTREGKRVVQKGQRVPQAAKEVTKRYIEELERRKIIRRSKSDWGNPITALPKGEGKVRLVSNLMALNSLTEKDPYQLANIKEVTNAAQGSTMFTVIDLKEGFYHIEIEEQDKRKTAFEFDGRVYEWNSMVMGFKNAPQIMQRVMNRVFEDLIGRGVAVYMDDILIYGRTVAEHDRNLELALGKLRDNNMKVNPEKIQLARPEVQLLGVSVNGSVQTPSEIKRNEALEFPKPTSADGLRRFLGLAGWFRSFIKNFSIITSELTEGLKAKKWEWNEGMELEFDNLKQELRAMQKLALADFNKELVLRTDASNVGMGAVLTQQNGDGEWIPIQWASKKFTPTECRYGITEKEMYAVYWGIKKFEYELRGRKFKIETDHKALEEIRRKPFFENNRINRWIEGIQEFDFEVTYRKGEENIVPDALSRIYEERNERENKKKKGDSIKAAKAKKHITEEDGKKYWTFDDGERREIPEDTIKEALVEQVHEKLNHRSMEAVYYNLKKTYYWPGMKAYIREQLRKCGICETNNRKKSGGSDFVQSVEPLEKVAIDLLDARSEGGYVMLAVDYFTRMARAEVLETKDAQRVNETMKKWIRDGLKPQELISDNGKEFGGCEFEKLCSEEGIKHRRVSVESHRSNGRIERLIGTVREGLVKVKLGTLHNRIDKIVGQYNRTYHVALKCTPEEAWGDNSGIIAWRNSKECEYASRFKKGFREKFGVGQVVKIAKRENLGGEAKRAKGRFINEGTIVAKCGGDSYLVKKQDGKIIKKRHYDLKGKSSETINRLEGDVVF